MKTPGASDFQLALDAMRDGVILWSADGRAIVANTAAARLFDLPDGLLRPGAQPRRRHDPYGATRRLRTDRRSRGPGAASCPTASPAAPSPR